MLSVNKEAHPRLRWKQSQEVPILTKIIKEFFFEEMAFLLRPKERKIEGNYLIEEEQHIQKFWNDKDLACQSTLQKTCGAGI